MLGAVVLSVAASACTLSHTPFKKRRRVARVAPPPEAIAMAEVSAPPENGGDEDREDLDQAEDASPPEPEAPPRPEPRAQPESPPPREPPPRAPKLEPGKMDSLARELKASPSRIETPCLDQGCGALALDRVRISLSALEAGERKRVRILHLGDSHVAADYITGTVRRELQAKFGDAGRGFVAVDQRAAYGGRRLQRAGWKRTRIVDGRAAGRAPFGFSGMALEAKRDGAEVSYALDTEDAQVTLFYLAHPAGGHLNAYVGDALIGELDTRAPETTSRTKTFTLPKASERRNGALVLEAVDAGVRLFGLSFETKQPGVLYDAIGPVGADARVYLALEPKSLREHLAKLAPDLIVLMIGGNDALAIRQGRRTLAEVKDDHRRLIRLLRDAQPKAECLLWSPMDAGEREGDRIVSKAAIADVRNIQAQVAEELGCGFWDLFASMGGEGSFGRWYRAGIMNEDLVHPRATAGELLGELFRGALIELYERSGR